MQSASPQRKEQVLASLALLALERRLGVHHKKRDDGAQMECFE
jgi:hypothetical protein